MKECEVVWLLVLFDLPAVTTTEKRSHVRYRNRLLRLGFTRLQWSVYARSYPTQRATEPDVKLATQAVPKGGRVRALYVTDLQFGRMVCVDGFERRAPEEPPEQVLVLDN